MFTVDALSCAHRGGIVARSGHSLASAANNTPLNSPTRPSSSPNNPATVARSANSCASGHHARNESSGPGRRCDSRPDRGAPAARRRSGARHRRDARLLQPQRQARQLANAGGGQDGAGAVGCVVDVGHRSAPGLGMEWTEASIAQEWRNGNAALDRSSDHCRRHPIS